MPPGLALRSPDSTMLDYRQRHRLRRLKTAMTVLFVGGMLLRVGLQLWQNLR